MKKTLGIILVIGALLLGCGHEVEEENVDNDSVKVDINVKIPRLLIQVNEVGK